MPSLSRALPAGFIAQCLHSSAPQPPSSDEWLHEIKHDGFRVIARTRVKLYSRPGNDLTDRFPLILSRRWPNWPRAPASSTARRWPAARTGSPASTASATDTTTRACSSMPSIRFNEHLDEHNGPLVFAHACKLGLEGIVSKRRNSPYRSGRSPDWIKSKNRSAPAMRREAEEDWGR
jgi:bifunctional non-homologous end joining protein LigD